MAKKTIPNTPEIDWFTGRGARISDSYVTITGRGTFLFNTGFILDSGLVNLSYVRFGFDKNKNAIYFDFTQDKKAQGVYKVVLRGVKSKSGSVTSRTFFKINGLDPENLAGKYVPEKVKIPRVGDLWCIDLNKKMNS
jgi:hypothetical protein